MIQKVSVWLAAFQLSQCFQNSPEARCFLVGCHRLGAQIHFTESLIHLEFSENSQNSSGFLAQQMENRSHGRWCCSCCSVTKSCLTPCDPMNWADHARITWLSYTDHVDDYTLITWLHMHWSCKWSGTYKVTIMHWSRGWSCTNHVTDHALIE